MRPRLKITTSRKLTKWVKMTTTSKQTMTMGEKKKSTQTTMTTTSYQALRKGELNFRIQLQRRSVTTRPTHLPFLRASHCSCRHHRCQSHRTIPVLEENLKGEAWFHSFRLVDQKPRVEKLSSHSSEVLRKNPSSLCLRSAIFMSTSLLGNFSQFLSNASVSCGSRNFCTSIL